MTNSAPTSRVTRFMFGIAAGVALTALILHVFNWLKTGVVNWAIAINISGLFVLMLTGVVDPPRGRLRNACTLVALLLIFPSAIWLFLK